MSIRPRPTGFALATAALVALCACSSAPPPSDAERVSSHMFANLNRVGEIQSALILGDLEGARRPARWIENYISAEHLGPEAVNYMLAIRSIARRVQQSTSIANATHALSELGAQCGRCHQSTSGGPKLSLMAPLPDGDERSDHMQRHLWGADRMWEGLIGPSDVFWKTGAAAFAEVPLRDEIWPGNETKAREWASRLHATGLEAATATSPERRAELYGELLNGCAGCHAEMGVGR